MTQKENQLLFIDLCGRLPYRVICHASKINLDGELLFINKVYNIVALYNDKAAGKFDTCSIVDVKPYLRPMSSMTEEERLYFHRNSARVQILVDEEKAITKPFYGYTIHLFDWLNSHHFDYRNLIEKGLAIEAPEGMYKTE